MKNKSAQKIDASKDLNTIMETIGKAAKSVSLTLANADTSKKNMALKTTAQLLRKHAAEILVANKEDMEAAKEKGLSAAMLDRLELNEARIASMAKGLEDIAKLPDPVGKELTKWHREENGLSIARYSVPLGVIGIIYESRPNVTADAGALCLKSGNAAILRGGSESFHSSRAIVACLRLGLKEVGLPEAAIQLVPTTDREAVGKMITMAEYIDVIVPRGGKGLCKRIGDESRVPTLQHLDGNCHTYIHKDADMAMALRVVVNAKMRRTGICGATESLVVDKAIAKDFLPKLIDRLTEEGCEVRGDKDVFKIDDRTIVAKDADWDTEYLAPVVSIKIINGEAEAIAFVNAHSSHHTDAIITENAKAAEVFLQQIDSAIVMHNTSTQFADGGEFGMGAEIGISTGRLHARGPVGVEQLTTYKYVVTSKGQIRPI